MSIGGIGPIEIQMLADLARVKSDMTALKSSVTGAFKGIEQAGSALKGVLGGLFSGLSVAGLGAWLKTAIDAGDATAELAQKTGIAAKDLAGLQLGFRQGGVDGDAFSGSMAKMSKQMVEGNKAFDQLGIKTRDSNGTLRSVKDVLYDTADAFEGMQDGAVKSALAQEIFGKTGAALIPTLSGGSQGLREMAEMADKLGLSMSEEAATASDQFNDTLDLLKGSTEGLGRQVAAELLPTLNSMAGAFLSNITQGDRLASVAEALGVGLKLVFSVVLGGVEVFNTFGKLVGGTIARIMAEIGGLSDAVIKVFQGDFQGALESAQGGFRDSANIAREMGADIVKGWGSTAKTISDVWTGEGAKTIEVMGGIKRATGEVTTATKEQEAAQKKSRDEMEKATKAGGDWLLAQDAQLASLRQEIELGRALTDGEKALAKMEEDLRAGKIKLTDAQIASAQAKASDIDALKAQRAEQEAGKKATEAATGARLKEYEALTAGVLKLEDEVAAQRAANETTLTGVDTTAQLAVAKLRDAAASADRQAIIALERKEDVALYEQFKAQADKLRELAALKEQGIHIKAAQDANKEWQKVTDTIGQGLTDSLFRAFESGKGFFKTLWSGIVNTFKTTALKLVIQGSDGKSGIMGSLMGALGLGGSGAAAASTGGGGLGSLGSLWSAAKGLFSGGGSSILGSTAGEWLGNFGGSVGNLVGNAGAGLYDMGLESIGSSLIGNNVAIGNVAGMAGDVLGYGGALLSASQGKWGAAIGSGVGTYFGGPIGAAIGNFIGGAVDKLFGGNGTHHSGAGYVSDGSTGFDVKNGGSGLDWSYGDSVGEYFSQPVQDVLKKVTGGSATMLNDLSKTFGGAGGYSVGGYFASDNDRESQGGRSVLLNGQVLSSWGGKGLDKDATKGLQQLTDALAGQVRDAMGQIDLPDWAREQLDALGSTATMESLATVVQAITQTKEALEGLGSFFAPLGGVFAQVAGLSADATMQLAEFAGGMDALIAKSQSFVQNYYSDDEQNAIVASQLQKALADAGITAALSSRDDFKALVNSTDVQTEEGRKQLATLLNLSETFAPIGDYLKDQGKTLADLAAQAPQVAALSALSGTVAENAQAQADYQQQTVDTLVQLDDTFSSVGDQITGAIVDLQNGIAQNAANTAQLTRLLERFDDGDALNVRLAA